MRVTRSEWTCSASEVSQLSARRTRCRVRPAWRMRSRFRQAQRARCRVSPARRRGPRPPRCACEMPRPSHCDVWDATPRPAVRARCRVRSAGAWGEASHPAPMGGGEGCGRCGVRARSSRAHRAVSACESASAPWTRELRCARAGVAPYRPHLLRERADRPRVRMPAGGVGVIAGSDWEISRLGSISRRSRWRCCRCASGRRRGRGGGRPAVRRVPARGSRRSGTGRCRRR